MAELNLGHVVGPGVPTGGTSGQVLKKNSSTNFDTSWTNNDATTIPMSSSDSTSINEAISNISSLYDLGTFSSESNLATALDTKISAMSNGKVASIRFQISSATDNFSAYTYVGTLTKISSQYASMTVAITTSSGFANIVTGSRNSTWVFKQLALNSNLIPSMLDVQDKSYTSGSINDLPYGIYRIYNSVTQIPIAVAGYCSCYLRENGTKLQVYTSDTNRTFTRTKVSGTWSNWEELATKSNTDVRAYFDSTYGYYGIETQNISQGSNGYLAMLIAPGANRLQLKFTVGTTTTTKNYTLTEN